MYCSLWLLRVLVLTLQNRWEVYTAFHWTCCRCCKYNNLELSVLGELIHCIICCFDLCPELWSIKYPSLGRATLLNSRTTFSLQYASFYITRRQISSTWPHSWICWPMWLGQYRTRKDASCSWLFRALPQEWNVWNIELHV
jgi:hypothetical protein